jgi:hypothetical protein
MDVRSDKASFSIKCRDDGPQQVTQPGLQQGKLPDLVVEDITLGSDCRVVVKVRNLGPGYIPDETWMTHKPESSSVYLTVNGKGWGGETIWKFDPNKSLQYPGGLAVYESDLKITGTATIKATVDHTKQIKETNYTNNERTTRLTCKAEVAQPAEIKEDCDNFNPATLRITKILGNWKIVDGNHWLFDFATKKSEADRGLSIIKNYRMNQLCFVGRPGPSFQYILVSGASPAGGTQGEDCVKFNPDNTTVASIQGRWKIVDGNYWMFDFGNRELEARQSLAIIKKYGFTYSCFVGRPDPSFRYLHK